MNLKETNIQTIYLEQVANEKLIEIRNEKPLQCCFKSRLVDAFIIGSCRAYFTNRIPKKLSEKKDATVSSISTPVLQDKEEILFFIQVIAYAYLLDQYSNKPDKLSEIHSILSDQEECRKIAERYFKGGWEIPTDNNFLAICNSQHPDSELFSEIDFSDIIEEMEE